MPKRTNDFQQLIVKIYESLMGDDVSITESGEIWDADGQILREVDILLERKTSEVAYTCMVECRDRSRKESIQWIDELIGKSRSLGVNKVVAVSSKGFAEAATKKAAANNIEIQTLTECLASDLPRWIQRGKMVIVDENYEFHIYGVRFFDVDRRGIVLPDNFKELLIRKRGTDFLTSFTEYIDFTFNQIVGDSEYLKVLQGEVDSRADEFRSYIVSKMKMPVLDFSVIMPFRDFYFYEKDGVKLDLRVEVVQLGIMVSMGVYGSERNDYRFSDNYVSVYNFGEKEEKGSLRVISVTSQEGQSLKFNPGAVKIIKSDEK